MTDRELLEAAAKAAGIGLIAWGRQFGEWGWFRNPTGEYWNPLTDDGDALRLAVKLHMTVRLYMGVTCAQIAVPGQLYAEATETDHANPGRATRSAIVRAAAELAK